jgi:hypothetical protein
VISLGIKWLLVYVYFPVVIHQLNNSRDHNRDNMDAYCLEVYKLKNKIHGTEFHHVISDNNVTADILLKLGSSRTQVLVGVFVHELHKPSIPEQAPVPSTTDPGLPQLNQEVMMIGMD